MCSFQWGHAKVNLLTGQFHHQEIDFKVERPFVDFSVWRAYNSQSQAKGIFGKGWCSNLEFRIQKNQYNGYDLIWCHRVEQSFRSKQKGLNFFSNRGVELRVHKNGFSFHSEAGADRKFNKAGQMIRWTLDSVRSPISLTYKNGIEVRSGNLKTQLVVKNGLVVSIKISGRGLSSYRYKKQMLISANIKGSLTQYGYTNQKRLSTITKKNIPLLAVGYNSKNLVTKIREANSCVENYEYSLLGKKQAEVVVKKSCFQKNLYKKAYQITFNKNNQITNIRRGPSGKSITLDPKANRLVREQTPFEIKTYQYDSRGRVGGFGYRSKEKKYQVKVKYNKNHKISKVQYSGDHSESVRLSYNRKNQLKRLENSKNELFYLKYNNGLVSSVKSRLGQLRYLYGKKNNLKGIRLAQGKRVFRHKLFDVASKPDDANQIAKYLNTMYLNLGPAYEDSPFLREVF